MGAVVHVHSPHAVALAAAGAVLRPRAAMISVCIGYSLWRSPPQSNPATTGAVTPRAAISSCGSAASAACCPDREVSASIKRVGP
ncbi:MAG TPA: hypothetical protein VMC78_05000 [Mycobacterium sp.]|nr:hypothetical protein [Mycobacterium sp.]